MRWQLLTLFLSACATLEGSPPPLQLALTKALSGKNLIAQCALHRAYFYDDPTRDLISPYRPGSRILALDSSGRPIPLRAKTNRVHPGSRWRLERVSSPTQFERIMRPLRSPRHMIWLHLRNGSSRAVLVLPSDTGTVADALLWLEPIFSTKEPAGLDGLDPQTRATVNNGRAVAGMLAEPARLALCSPDQVYVDETVSPPLQKWIYLHQQGDHRAAVFVDGRSTGKLIPLSAEELARLEQESNEKSH